MDNQRIILFLALAIVVLFMWEAWEEKTNPRPQIVVQQPATSTISSSVDTVPENSVSNIPDGTTNQDVPIISSTVEKPIETAQTSIQSKNRIRVVTDVLDIDIDSIGGDLRRAFLVKYPLTLDQPDKPYPYMDDKLPRLFIAQSGLLSSAEAPNHYASYEIEQSEYRLAEGQNELRVPLKWTSKDGKITVTKTYVFHRDSYLIDVIHDVNNASDEPWRGRLYTQLQRTDYDEPGQSRLLYTFTGAAISNTNNNYEKIDFDEMSTWKPDQSYDVGGWVSMIQHYFVTAWIPGKEDVNQLYTRVVNDSKYIVGLSGEETVINPGATSSYQRELYIGPKDQDRMEKVAENLKLTVDYGILSFIAQPLFWLLQFIHEYIGNWGWAIIFVTLIIKLVFYKLSEASYRSMGNMRKIAPKFQAIRERYGDDRQRMSQAMMELYKKEKVNPMSGCWPMLVQIPVFISLYWMLLESVELRHAPFMLWIEDLSTKDPYYVLPLLMGASMYVQQKLSHNPSLDPMHQKIMQFLPIIFTFFFMLFPAGLVLYWVVNSVLSILQQWYIMRKIENAPS